jgi:hypothetical protein
MPRCYTISLSPIQHTDCLGVQGPQGVLCPPVALYVSGFVVARVFFNIEIDVRDVEVRERNGTSMWRFANV